MKRRVLAVVLVVASLALFETVRQHGQKLEKRVEDGRTVLSVALLWWEYGQLNEGVYPPLDPRPGVFLFDVSKVRAGYRLGPVFKGREKNPGNAAVFGDLNANIAYSLEDLVEPNRYFYLGYAVANEAEGNSLLEAYRTRAATGGDFSEDLKVEKGRGTLGTDTLRMLNLNLLQTMASEGVAFNPATVLPSTIPVMIERPAENDPPGGWVVYLDRQMKWLPYPGPFPMTEEFIRGLEDLSKLAAERK